MNAFAHPSRAIDQFGQVIDVWSPRSATPRRPTGSSSAIDTTQVTPAEAITDQGAGVPQPCWRRCRQAAWHRTDQDASNGIECDHGRLKSRLRPDARTQAGLQRQGHRRTRLRPERSAWLPRTGGRVPIGRRLTVAVYRLALAIDPELASTP
jgi:hypothetical protein